MIRLQLQNQDYSRINNPYGHPWRTLFDSIGVPICFGFQFVHTDIYLHVDNTIATHPPWRNNRFGNPQFNRYLLKFLTFVRTVLVKSKLALFDAVYYCLYITRD